MREIQVTRWSTQWSQCLLRARQLSTLTPRELPTPMAPFQTVGDRGLNWGDNHCPLVLVGPDRRRFENGPNEANIEPLADFDSGFDTNWASLSGPGGGQPYRHTPSRRGTGGPGTAQPERTGRGSSFLPPVVVTGCWTPDWPVWSACARSAPTAAATCTRWSASNKSLNRRRHPPVTTPQPSGNPLGTERNRRRDQIRPGLSQRLRHRPVRALGACGGRSGRPLARDQGRAVERSGSAALRSARGPPAGQTAATPLSASATAIAICTAPIRCTCSTCCAGPAMFPSSLLHLSLRARGRIPRAGVQQRPPLDVGSA